MKLKFRLSTVFLLVSVVALAFGWYLERFTAKRRLELEQTRHDEAIDRMWLGLSTSADVEQLTRHVDAFRSKQPAEYARWMDSHLLSDLWRLWLHEDDINHIGEGPAASLAAEVLTRLGCRNEDEFLSFVRKFTEDDESFPELFDTKSPEHAALQMFLSRAFEAQRKNANSP